MEKDQQRNEDFSGCAARRNISFNKSFFLLGFCDLFYMNSLLFLGFFLVYLLAFVGNFLILTLTTLDPKLHTPMYFFLRNLSLVEFCYNSVILPKLLQDLFSKDGHISFIGCAIQMFFFCFLGTTECFLLGVMAYDRYVAICQPLRYAILLAKKACFNFNAVCWATSFLLSVIMSGWIFSLPFCNSRTIEHYFCELLPLIALACSDTFWIIIELIVYDIIAAFIPFILVLISYIKILSSIFRLHHADRRKAFSTCSSHLLCVSLFYSSGMVSYIIPKSVLPKSIQRVPSLFYAILIPMLNPLIYGIRNAEVKAALKKLVYGKLCNLQL